MWIGLAAPPVISPRNFTGFNYGNFQVFGGIGFQFCFIKHHHHREYLLLTVKTISQVIMSPASQPPLPYLRRPLAGENIFDERVQHAVVGEVVHKKGVEVPEPQLRLQQVCQVVSPVRGLPGQPDVPPHRTHRALLEPAPPDCLLHCLSQGLGRVAEAGEVPRVPVAAGQRRLLPLQLAPVGLQPLVLAFRRQTLRKQKPKITL